MKLNLPIIMAFFYRLLFQRIDNNKVVFTSSFNTSFDYNAKYLFEYMHNEYKDLNCLYVMNDKNKLQALEEQYGGCFINTKTFKGAFEALSAGAWVVSAGLPVYIPFANRKRFILNIGHGMPFKKSGLKSVEVNRFNKMFYKLIFSKNYSAVSCTSRFFGKIITDNFEIPNEKALCLGQARNDMLYKTNDRNRALNDFYKISGKITSHSKLILYAPTFRDEGFTQFFPFQDYDKQKLQDFLCENDIFIFLRPHKHEKSDYQQYACGNIFILDNNKIEDIMEIINIFDMLITDYSSIFLDYLILERPMIFIPYDYDIYSKIRGFVYDYNTYTPGEKILTMNEFVKVLGDYSKGIDSYKERRQHINDLFNEVKNGSCKMHADTIRAELDNRKVRKSSNQKDN